jgi:hypothetical protein
VKTDELKLELRVLVPAAPIPWVLPIKLTVFIFDVDPDLESLCPPVSPPTYLDPRLLNYCVRLIVTSGMFDDGLLISNPLYFCCDE